MAKWIIEADIYRLQKELQDGVPTEKRPRILEILARKKAQLELLQQ